MWHRGMRAAKYVCLLETVALVLLFLGGCGQPVDRMFAQADKALLDGQYLEAYFIYREIVEEYPETERADEALFTAGELSLLFLNNVGMAIGLFNQLIEQYPRTTYYFKAKRYLAEVYAKTDRECPKLVVEFQSLIDRKDRPELGAEYQYKIAECYFKNDDFPQAIVEYRAVERNYPESGLAEDALFQIANSYYILGNYEEALRQYGKLEDRYPGGKHATDAIIGKASSLEELGRYKESLSQYERLFKQERLKAFAKKSIERINRRLVKK